MDDLLFEMNNYTFDSDKLRAAKQFIRNNDVYSNDVLRMMQALDFESNRLALAKFAYRFSLDPDNYYLVEDGLEFRSSKSQQG